MPLDPATEKRIRDEAARRNTDPDKAVAHAEGLATKKPATGSDSAATVGGHPTFDRFLLGALPYVTVREFRTIWLGLDARIADDELTTGDFLAKHGGAGSPASTDAEPPA